MEDGLRIFEFDLKGFFNNVSIDRVEDSLRKRGVPEMCVAHIIRVSSTLPLIPLQDYSEDDPEVTRSSQYGRRANTEGLLFKQGLPQGLP